MTIWHFFCSEGKAFSGSHSAALFVATKTSWVFMMLPLRWNDRVERLLGWFRDDGFSFGNKKRPDVF